MCRINGKTLVGRAIETTAPVCEVVVSSDDTAILAEAENYGANTIRRPADLSTGTASSRDGLRHAVDNLGYHGTILFVQCTAPLMTTEDVRACAEEWEGIGLAAVVHEWHGFVMNKNGKCLNFPLDLRGSPRRQDLEPVYVVAGSVWACDTSYLERQWWSPPVQPIVRPGFRLEIDSQEDLDIAKKLLE